jgi:hypothetical protein
MEPSNAAAEGVQLLRTIANQIEANGPDPFGGALVLIPPSGDPRALVQLTTHPNPNFFWTQVGALLRIIEQEIEQEENKSGYR